jgi:hypothetical protein
MASKKETGRLIARSPEQSGTSSLNLSSHLKTSSHHVPPEQSDAACKLNLAPYKNFLSFSGRNLTVWGSCTNTGPNFFRMGSKTSKNNCNASSEFNSFL